MSQSARPGQSLLEFALVLPALLLVGFILTELLLIAKTQGALSSIASAAVHDAALAGGESAAVDSAIVSLAQQNGLAPSLVRLRIDTSGGAGSWHVVDGQGVPPGQDGSAWYPPPAAYNGDITVHLTYTYALTLPLLGPQSWTIPADASEASQMDPGVLPQ